MSKQTKITRSAKDEECQARIPGVCNGNPETVVFAHLNGGGAGMKHSDIHGCYACSECHSFLDYAYTQHEGVTRDDRDLYHLQAMVRTQLILLDKGLIKVPK